KLLGDVIRGDLRNVGRHGAIRRCEAGRSPIRSDSVSFPVLATLDHHQGLVGTRGGFISGLSNGDILVHDERVVRDRCGSEVRGRVTGFHIRLTIWERDRNLVTFQVVDLQVTIRDDNLVLLLVVAVDGVNESGPLDGTGESLYVARGWPLLQPLGY